jgi:hypothetical protein
MLKTHFMYSHIQSFQEKQSVHTHRKKPPKTHLEQVGKLAKEERGKNRTQNTDYGLWNTRRRNTSDARAKNRPREGTSVPSEDEQATTRAVRGGCCKREQSRAPTPRLLVSRLHSTPRTNNRGVLAHSTSPPAPPPPLPHKRQQLPTIPFPSPPFFLRPPPVRSSQPSQSI